MPVTCNELVADAGHIKWSATRDRDGYTDYRITHRIRVDDTPESADGPSNALRAAGLPIPGYSIWIVDGDTDLTAVCQWDATVNPVYDGERCKFFDVEQVFSNRPDPRCLRQTGTGTGTGNPAEEPLLFPPRISGSFFKRTIQAQYDFSDPIQPLLNSSHEKFSGPQVDIDQSLLTVVVEVNQSTIDLIELSLLMDAINETVMWGFAISTLRLTDIVWQQLYYADCSCYYNVRYEFTYNPDGWHKQILDEGTKALNGKFNSDGDWEIVPLPNGNAPDVNNPSHFVRIKDAYDNIVFSPLKNGVPVEHRDEADFIEFQMYPAFDFFFYVPELPTSIECP